MTRTPLDELRAILERIDAYVDPKTGQRGAGAASQPFLRELRVAIARAEAALAAGMVAPLEPEPQDVTTLPDAHGRPELKPLAN